MKRLTAVLSVLLTLTLLGVLPAEAQRGQHPGQHGQQGMMQGGMMGQGMMQMMRGMHQQMMQNPMHRARMTTFMLPALADTLGLSDEQLSELQQLRSEAMAHGKEQRKQMMDQRKQFMSLFEGDDQPSSGVVREHLTTMAEMRANQQAAMYDTAQKMHGVLTADQRQMLSSLTPRQRMRQMMSHMPMMDMMQMMQSMHGGMMQRGMMSGPGMQEGGMMNMPMQKGQQNQ